MTFSTRNFKASCERRKMEDILEDLARAFAMQFYYKNFLSKPASKFDGKRSIILSCRESHPECLKGGNQDLHPAEYCVMTPEGESVAGASVCAVYECPSSEKVAKESKAHHFHVDCLQLAEILDWTSMDDKSKDSFVSVVKSTIQRFHLKNSSSADIHFVEFRDDKIDRKEPIRNQHKTTKDQHINGTDMVDGQAEFLPIKNIGESLAAIYYMTVIKFNLQRMRGQVDVHPFKSILPFLVIDCSEEAISQTSHSESNPAPVGWIGTCAKDKNWTHYSQVFSVRASNEEVSHVLIDYPEPLATLKMMRTDGLLTNDDYQREFKQFTKTLRKILNDQELKHEATCTIFDGSIGLLEHIEQFDRERVNVLKSVDYIDSDVEVDGPDCPDDTAAIPSLGNGFCLLSKNSRDVPVAQTDIIVIACDPVSDDCSWFVSKDPRCSAGVNANSVVHLNTNMVVAAFKQEHIISDDTVSQLTAIGSLSGLRQACVVLQLILFMISLNSSLYPGLVKSFEGLRQRAETSKERTVKEERTRSASGENSHQESTKNEKVEKQSPKVSREKKGPEARSQVIANILFTMIEDKNYFPYDFEVHLRNLIFENKQDVTKLRNKEGLSLLHAIVVNIRPQYLLPLFRAGCWSEIRGLKADKGPYEGKTAEDICVGIRFRKIQKEMDTYTTWEKSLNQIHIAARRGDMSEMKRLLKFSEDLHHMVDEMGCTSLYWAVVGGNVDIVKLLFNKKVDYTKVNSRKETLLHVACMIGHKHLLVTLVKDFKMDFSVKDSAKKSALLRVAENGDEKSLAKLMKCGLKSEQLGPMLAIAGHYGRLPFLKKVIEEYGVDPLSKDDAGKTAFMRACEQSRINVAKYLLSKGTNIKETDVRRRNVLHMAADGATVEMMEFLIAEIKKREDGVLKEMLNYRDKYIGGELCMLIRGKDKGRDSWHYVEVSRGLMDIFMKKTRSGTIDVAKYGSLLHSGWGLDPDEESAKEIERRFETRRNANLVEDLDVTPLHIAAFKDKEDVAEVLMNCGSDVNCRDKFGLTPLHVAAMRGNIAIVRSMLKRGAEADVLDNLVKTPIEVAEDNEHKDVANFIRSFQYIPVAQNFRERIIPNILSLISEDYIQELQNTGRDFRTHLINTLRDLTIDINESLLSLGSGPVLEESMPNEPQHKP